MRIGIFIRTFCLLTLGLGLCCGALPEGPDTRPRDPGPVISTNHRAPSAAAVQAAVSSGMESWRMLAAAWYSLYIMVCLGVLVYWEYRRWRAHSWLDTAFRR